jgi:hypothetical protein
MKVTFYIGPDGSVGAGTEDGHVITSSGTTVRLTPDWHRTAEFGEDDLSTEAAVVLATKIRLCQERLVELQKTRDLIGLIKHIRQSNAQNDITNR